MLCWTLVTLDSLCSWNTSFSPSGPQRHQMFMKTLTLRSLMPQCKLSEVPALVTFPICLGCSGDYKEDGVGKTLLP